MWPGSVRDEEWTRARRPLQRPPPSSVGDRRCRPLCHRRCQGKSERHCQAEAKLQVGGRVRGICGLYEGLKLEALLPARVGVFCFCGGSVVEYVARMFMFEKKSSLAGRFWSRFAVHALPALVGLAASTIASVRRSLLDKHSSTLRYRYRCFVLDETPTLLSDTPPVPCWLGVPDSIPHT